MSHKRSTILKLDSAAPAAATTTIALGAPSWAKTATLIVKGTTAGASTIDAKVQMVSPDGVATAAVDSGVAIDQIAASATAVGRFVSWGEGIGAALAGTSIDALVVPVSKHQQILVTTVGTCTNLKVWVEFQGE